MGIFCECDSRKRFVLAFNHIGSKDNPLVKRIVRLANESKFRHSEEQAVIYGEHLLQEAIKYGLVEQVLILEDAVTKYQYLINLLTNPQAIKLVSIEIMRKLNILDSLSEIVAVIKIKPILAEPSLTQDSLVLENIQDPGNLGTILRAAYASGITQIVLSPKSVDAYNPKVLRASQGIQFGLQIYTGIELAQWLTKYRGQVLAMVPQANLNLYQQDLLLTTALVLGNEGNGLSCELLAQLKNQISIPMLGGAESLNLAMAATIGLFEMSRQRVVNQRK